MTRNRSNSLAYQRLKLIPLAVAACFGSAPAVANPTGAQVVNGAVGFARPNASTLNVTNSPGAIINWQGFSIGASEVTRFIQQSASSAVLNRVVGGNISQIQGQLLSNGRVFLINPSGIVVGPGAVIDTAGFVGSTLNILDADFLAGRLKFQGDANSGSIINQGWIKTASGGQVILVAPQIENSGLIHTPEGQIILAAGMSLTIASLDHEGVQFEVQAPTDAVVNVGKLLAEGGAIGVFAGTLRHSGDIRATSLSTDATGQIVLKASGSIELAVGSTTSAGGAKGGAISVEAPSGLLQLGGSVDARGSEDAGGVVAVKGNVVISTGQVDASGTSGGSIAVDTRNYLGSGIVSADGTAGVGGNIGIHASGRIIQTTGESLSARGTGDGGKIVIAGADRVFSSATADASGQRGGEVNVLSREIVLLGANVNASGTAGGGTVLVGGDYRGENPSVLNASTTFINYSTSIRADGGNTGDGGKVIVWSDKDTQFAGSISARGGAQAGNGGFVEVSGKENLVFAGMADAGAPKGTPGTVLLDPKNIIIDAAGSGGLSSFQLLDPNPGDSEFFASSIAVLPNNNVVATDSSDSFVAVSSGAAYLFDGVSGALLSTITGSAVGDSVGFGGVVALTGANQNNFVVASRLWNGSRGAATWGNGTSGFLIGGGAISSSNSLVGSTASDGVGTAVTALTNGNYVVTAPSWDNGATADVGAVTWGNGATGRADIVGTGNSLHGTQSLDFVGGSGLGTGGIVPLSNGHYVVSSPNWKNGTQSQAGAVTWVDGSTGIPFGAGSQGVTVSAANSLVGSISQDNVGGGIGAPSVTALSNGNYVVTSSLWDFVDPFDFTLFTNVGAITLGNGAGGTVGAVSGGNSLIGSLAGDAVGNSGVTRLNNGNFVVVSQSWNASRGAVTWGHGSTGFIGGNGVMSAANSLVGSTPSDAVGSGGVTALSNGNYVVKSPSWDNVTVTDAGAVTWGSGSAGTTGPVLPSNSLVGSSVGDQVGSGGVAALSNGNYVVSSPGWTGTASAVGAVTWVNGANGIPVGAGSPGVPVSSANSLVGTTASDAVGVGGVTALTNGNYVVSSPFWDNSAAAAVDAGAATWGNGAGGTVGDVTTSNSLHGTSASDRVAGGPFGSGSGGVVALSNGNYIVVSSRWSNGGVLNDGFGAVTWGNGNTGITGAVSTLNSLTGAATGDKIGSSGVTALSNGNYVVRSEDWGSGGISGDGKGAVTWVNGSNGRAFGESTPGAQVSASNSLVGTVAGDLLTCGEGCSLDVTTFSNGNYVVKSPEWDNGITTNVGAVTFGSGATGVAGAVNSTNSLIGSLAFDGVGSGGVVEMSNGNFVVRSPGATNGSFLNAGLVHVVSPSSQYFGIDPAGSVTIAPSTITQMTNTGTAVTLQANNDITLNAGAPITTSAGGAGGAITLQAGRNITLNSSITTDNGNLSITANDASAQAVNRDAGSGGITIASGTTLNAGTGNMTLQIGAGPGAGTPGGDISIASILANDLALLAGASGVITGSGSITLSGSIFNVTSNGTSALSGVISGTAGLIKSGTGSLTLSGANTYSGGTSIGSGTLAISGSGTAGTGTIVVGANTLDVIAGANVTNAVTVNGGTIGNSSGAGTLSAGGVTLLGNSNLSSNAAAVLTVSASIGDGGSGFGVTKAGTGTLTLSGANTYAGATTVSAGTLAVANAAGLGSTAGGTTVAGGAVLDLQNVAVGAEALTLNGGTLAASTGSSSLTGAITLGAASVVDVAGTQLVLSGGVTNGGNVLTVTGAGDTSITGAISGTGGLTKAGAGTLALSGTNTYSGVTTINAGTLSTFFGSAIGDGSAVVMGGGVLSLATSETVGSLAGTGSVALGANTLTVGGDGTSTIYSGVIGDTGGLTKVGAGTLTLSGANTYAGATTVSAGTLAVANAAGLGSTAGGTTVAGGAVLDLQNVAVGAEALTLNGGTLAASTGTSSLSGAITLGAASVVDVAGTQLTLSGGVANGGNLLTVTGAGDTSITGAISGTGGLTKAGAGTLALSGTNTYSGVTTINAGTLSTFFGSAIGDGSAVVMGGGVLSLATSETVGSLAGTGSVALGANTLTVGGDGTSTIYSGVIGDTGGLTKVGAGTLTLSGANTYTGATTVNAGALQLNGGAAIVDTGAVNLAVSGAGLALGASETIGSFTGVAGTTVALGGNTLTVGDGTSTTFAGVMGGTGGLTKQGGGTLTLSGANTYTGTTAVNAGTLAVTGGALDGPLVNQATVNLNGATIAGLFTNSGTANVNGSSTAGGGVTQVGTLNLAGGQTLTVGGAGFDWQGGTLAGAGSLGMSGGAPFNITTGATHTLNGPTISMETLDLTGGNLDLQSGTVNVLLDINVGSGTTLASQGATINAPGATMNVSGIFQAGTGSFTVGNTNVLPGGLLKGVGTVNSNVTNDGAVAPGASPGILTINGNYTQGPTGVLNMEIGGTTPGAQYDQLVVTGLATLGGALNATFINGFSPAPTDFFTLLQASSVSGTFASTNLPSGSFLAPTYLATSFFVSAPPTGIVTPTVVQVLLDETKTLQDAVADGPASPEDEPQKLPAPICS